MSSPQATQLVPIERIEKLIHLARGEKVLLDTDLAQLYGVSTGALNRAVKRNLKRFPTDFMFELTDQEAEILKCQSGISSSGHGGRRRSRHQSTLNYSRVERPMDRMVRGIAGQHNGVLKNSDQIQIHLVRGLKKTNEPSHTKA